jgi:hypothetical protein
METGSDYIPTQSELQAFLRDKNGYPTQSIKTYKKVPQTHGKLVLIEGKHETIIHFNKPFALLNYFKRQMIQNGYKKENLFVKNI